VVVVQVLQVVMLGEQRVQIQFFQLLHQQVVVKEDHRVVVMECLEDQVEV
jgi:hypothetical protein